MAPCQEKAENYSADQMMHNVALSLVRDFQANFDDPVFQTDFQRALLSGDVAEYRGLAPAPTANSCVDKFKATYQLQSLFKRYRFGNDIYSLDELTQKACSGFKETQIRIQAVDFDALDTCTKRTLDYARIYIANVLGKYSDEEHRNLCRFGRRASIGIPSRKACEAARWELPISGSKEQIAWFDSEMSQIDSVQEYWTEQMRAKSKTSGTTATYQPTSSLTLTLVPKTFKSLRSIMPNTTIGSYMSFGLGEMMRIRLKRKGYDISDLQQRHRVLARCASIDGKSTTADLSSASDSISVRLVNLLFPADWLKVLHQSRIGIVDLPDGSSIESETFGTMGIGYTFPLQTLVFLSLLKAIEATLFNRWNRKAISVYGDDMIYESSLHNSVVNLFEKIGFVLNVEKTFHEGEFRESCGGDYYRGVDVRPFQPRNGSVIVGSKTYEAMLYKYVNGLLARWSEHEIGRTLRYLCTEIERVTGRCKLVPNDFPDDSGIKCPTFHHWSFLQGVEAVRPKHVGHGVYRFSYLRLVSETREEVRHEPYYWLALRGITVNSDNYAGGSDSEVLPNYNALIIDSMIGIKEDVRPLHVVKVEPIKMIRNFLGHRIPLTTTVLTTNHTGSYKRRTGLSCFWSP